MAQGGELTNQRIKTARNLKGLTQAELGRLIGCSAPFVSMMEKGKKMPSAAHIKALADVLGVREEWLRTGEGPMTTNELGRDRRSIGERLYQKRKELKMNQTEFGALLGVSRLTISLLETGKISASPKIISAAVEKLDVSEHWLRSGDPVSETAQQIISWLSSHPADRAAVYDWLVNEKGLRSSSNV